MTKAGDQFMFKKYFTHLIEHQNLPIKQMQ